MSGNSLDAILVLEWQHLELVGENDGNLLVCVGFVIILGLSFFVCLIWLVFVWRF